MIEGKYKFLSALQIIQDMDYLPLFVRSNLSMKEDFVIMYGNTTLEKGDILYWDNDERLLISKF